MRELSIGLNNNAYERRNNKQRQHPQEILHKSAEKEKEVAKKQVAMIDGKPVKHLRYDYLGCYYWIK